MKGGETIATTRIIPLHATKSKSVARSIGDILDYGKNPQKTDNGKLVSCYECDPVLCNDQFLMKKQIYAEVTHKQETNNKRNVLAYQIRQSFSPDDKVTPEQANKIGMELARKFAGDDFQLVVCTHVDKAHIHNHIYINSTSLDCSRKFENEYYSAEKIQVISDTLCQENGLSVVGEKENTGVDYGLYLDKKNGIDWKAILKADIDKALTECTSIEDFKQKLQKQGYTLRGKKSLSLKHPDQKRGMKTERVSAKQDYSLQGIEYALKHGGHILPKQKNIDLTADKELRGLHDLENKTGGLRLWAEKQNLKELAKSYNFMKANSIIDYKSLCSKIEENQTAFDFTTDKIKQVENDIEKNKVLRVHIQNYAKTADLYKKYQSSRHKEKFYEEHKGNILLHEASRQAFKSLGLRTLPKTGDLKNNIDSLYKEKSELYAQYKEQKAELKNLETIQKNLDTAVKEIQKQEKKKQQER